VALPLAFDRIPLGGDRNANRDDNIDIDGGLFGGEFLRPYPLSATPTRVVATCAAMDRRPGIQRQDWQRLEVGEEPEWRR
jgi:hypothetical protein